MDGSAGARARLPYRQFIRLPSHCRIRPAPSDKTASLVLQGPTVDANARSLRQQVVRLLVNSRRGQRSMGRVMIADYWAAGARRVYDTIKLALSDEIEEKLPRITAPALVVRGERDPVVPQDWAERVASLLPRGKLQVIPRAAHTINFSMPSELAAAIERFVVFQ
jgi:pimeloyl-ACP methyl ester carboxylesterase